MIRIEEIAISGGHSRPHFLRIGLALLLGTLLPALPVVASGPQIIDLGLAGSFAILAGADITTTGGGSVEGNVGASPISGSAIGVTGPQVNGTIYAVDDSGPAGSVHDSVLLNTAKGDMMAAYKAAAERTPVPAGSYLNPGAGNIGGMNLIAGLYKFTGTASIVGADLTLTGTAEDVWIFQIAADLQVGSGIQVFLAGGARADHIFWQVGTSAVLETFSVFKGTIIADQSITLRTSSVMEGRALAFEAGVVFDGNSIGLVATSLWSNATNTGEGWKYLDWFGNFYDAGDGWIYHQELGWLYTKSSKQNSIWFWFSGIGWMWTSNSMYPYLHLGSGNTWLWYQEGSRNPRWFFNYSSNMWESR